MSYYTDFYGRHECGDNELAGWSSKFKEEFLGTDSRKGFLAELDTKLKISACNIDNYKSIREQMKDSFNQLVADLDLILGKKGDSTLNLNDVVAMKAAIKDKIKNFEGSLTKMKDLIGEEMYDNKLNHFFLKLKAILLGIANCFFDRDLHYYRRTVVGEGFAFSSAGPACYNTPVYILPDRPSISLFFSEQINKEIEKIEKNLPQFNCN